MITIHLWKCVNCDTRLFLREDSNDQRTLVKLLAFTSFVTKHCIDKNHHVTHLQKEEFKAKYV